MAKPMVPSWQGKPSKNRMKIWVGELLSSTLIYFLCQFGVFIWISCVSWSLAHCILPELLRLFFGSCKCLEDGKSPSILLIGIPFMVSDSAQNDCLQQLLGWTRWIPIPADLTGKNGSNLKPPPKPQNHHITRWKRDHYNHSSSTFVSRFSRHGCRGWYVKVAMLVEHPTSPEKQQLTPEQKKTPKIICQAPFFRLTESIVVIQVYIPVVNVEFITYNPS